MATLKSSPRLGPAAAKGLAHTLWSLARRDEAADHSRALLDLNPDDNQGVRSSLLGLLLELDRDAESAALKQNPFVPTCLTGHSRIPNMLPPDYGYGDGAEAIHHAYRYLAHRRRTPGALEWLASRSQ